MAIRADLFSFLFKLRFLTTATTKIIALSVFSIVTIDTTTNTTTIIYNFNKSATNTKYNNNNTITTTKVLSSPALHSLPPPPWTTVTTLLTPSQKSCPHQRSTPCHYHHYCLYNGWRTLIGAGQVQLATLPKHTVCLWYVISLFFFYWI